MLIEDLIRLGGPLLDSSAFGAEDVLRLITGVEDERVKNFYRHVFVVEVPVDDRQSPRVLPMQQFGDIVRRDGKEDFAVDQTRALGAPFVLPSGGNPLNPQGRYLPVYPCYDRHIQEFRDSAEGVKQFLVGRLERTIAFSLSDGMVDAVASALHEALKATDFGNEKKVLGILILARCEPDEYFTLQTGSSPMRIGTIDGASIVPNFERILEGFWAAKLEEGKEAGSRTGACSFFPSGTEGEVVSAYCKAWPWAFPTWTCPLPLGGDERMLVESVALSPETYRALTLGACVFNRWTQPVDRLMIIPELFSPADTRVGKDQAKRRRDLTVIQGSGFLLPVQDRTLSDPTQRGEFVKKVWNMLEASRDKGSRDDPTLAGRYMTAVTGFDFMLPRGTNNRDYRLTLVYFSGEVSRGDVHLRAFIQDVIPSTLGCLRKLARTEAKRAMQLLRIMMPKMSEKQDHFLGKCYSSVPYLLARAYGGAYLWQQLEAVLHRQPLDHHRVVANAARRMQSLTPQWPDSRFELYEEVGFYLGFQRFLKRINHELASLEGDDDMPTRPWDELIRDFERKPIEVMEFRSIEELGFACGLLVRRFSGWYSAVLGRNKDFIRDRVLTFGASLTPREVWVLGVKGIRDVAAKFDKLRLHVELGQLAHYDSKEERKQHRGDYAKRYGVILHELERRSEDIGKHRDEFMTGFWSGYSLQGFDRPSKPEKN